MAELTPRPDKYKAAGIGVVPLGPVGTHAPEWGHEYYGQRYGQAIHTMLSSIGL